MYQQILVPIDPTKKDFGSRALPLAIELARLIGAKLNAVTVVPDVTALPNLPANYADETKKGVRETVQGLIGELNADIPLAVREGSIYRQILEEAENIGADLIIIAAEKHKISDYLLGTNANQVVRHANCSVHVMRVPD